jgi:hypothetical protein
MAKIKLGDADNQLFTTTTDITGDTITFGVGNNDSFQAPDNSISDSQVTFGNGYPDSFLSLYVSSSTITFGDGSGDSFTSTNVSSSTITLGDGSNDLVTIIPKVHHGVPLAPLNLSNSTIILGNGDEDRFFVPTADNSPGTFDNNTIVLGNGNCDQIGIGTHSEDSYNTLTVGNGQKDSINIFTASGGGDLITTGTGAGDQVEISNHTIADTFAFSLGTNGSAFTTVSATEPGGGALPGDQIVANTNGNGNAYGNALGNTLVAVTNVMATDMAGFINDLINDLGPLQKGDTYVGNNGSDTFIVTETQSGKMGAIELQGVHTVGMGNHILTVET